MCFNCIFVLVVFVIVVIFIVVVLVMVLFVVNYGVVNLIIIGEKCVNLGDIGQIVEIVCIYFDGFVGIWIVFNYNVELLLLICFIKEIKIKIWNVFVGVDFDILKLVNIKFSVGYIDFQIYEVGEIVGLYNVVLGKIVVMCVGWVVFDFVGEKIVCGQDGIWQGIGEIFIVFLLVECYVEVFICDNMKFNQGR